MTPTPVNAPKTQGITDLDWVLEGWVDGEDE